MNDFKGRHFTGEVILWAVRWYCRYGISYRDLEEMLSERGIDVDHTTIYRWVQRYAPEMEKRLRWFWRRGFDPSWRLDETYVKVRANGPTCTGRSTNGATRLISICHRHAAPKRRSAFWAKLFVA
jgi:transposase-like protein